MTKTISKTVRLLITTALFAVLFSLNITSEIKTVTIGESHIQNQSAMIELGGGRVLAQGSGQNGEMTTADSDVQNGKTAQASADQAASDKAVADSLKTDAEKAAEKKPDPTKILESVANASLYVVRIFNPLIHFITFKIGPFLGNDYIFAGNMGEMLHRIWIINRNIVNIVFVLVLLYLALKFIINGDETGITKNIGKFAIMLVAINFSWLAGRLVLDAANVATNVVFAIPAGISGVGGQTFDEILKEKKNECVVNKNDKGIGVSTSGYCIPIPESSYLVLDANETYNYPKSDKWCDPANSKNIEAGYLKNYPISGKKPDVQDPAYWKVNTICWKQMELKDYQQNNASYYLSYSMAKVQNLVKNDQTDLINTAVGTLFSLVLQVAYLAAYISLFIVLIIRAAMMWILMAFSPYIVLLMYLKQIGIGVSLGKADSLLSIQGFVKWAFAPAKVGAVWTIGFIMITAGQTMDTSSFEKIGGHIYGAGTLFMGMDTVQQFIWYMMSLGIIWVGTFSMFADLEVAGGITNAIKGGVEKYGMMGAKGVGSRLPIFPTFDDKGKMTMGNYGQFASGTPLANIGSGGGTSTPGFTSNAEKTTKIQNAAEGAKNNPNDEAKIAELLQALKDNGVSTLDELKKHEGTIKDSSSLKSYYDVFVHVLSGKTADGKEKEKPKVEVDKNAGTKPDTATAG